MTFFVLMATVKKETLQHISKQPQEHTARALYISMYEKDIWLYPHLTTFLYTHLYNYEVQSCPGRSLSCTCDLGISACSIQHVPFGHG